MAEAATPLNAPSIKPGQVYLSGRIRQARKYEDRFYYVLALPAPDAFSMPALCELASDRKIGSPGDDWAGVCVVGGYPNDFKDRTGEKVYSARNTLTVV